VRLLITGGTGMLGSALVSAAKLSAYEVLVPNRSDLNLGDSSQVKDYFSANHPEVVIHAAARVGGIAANIAHPVEFLTENIEIDSHVLSAARTFGVKRLVYVGSSCMYPKDTSNPMRVDQLLSGKLEPTNEGYAIAKLVGTKHVQYVAETTGWAWRNFIPSNLYGPGDHFSPDRSHLLAAVIQKVVAAKLGAMDFVSMWGDGSVRREFTYVQDVADFMVDSLAKLKDLPVSMNIGCGVDYSVLEYYKLVIEELRAQVEIIADLSKPVGMAQKLLDVQTAKSLGWNPLTSITDGIRATIDWYLSTNKIILPDD
jgi:nucleoside-diphosphate-sugar epimerase